MQIIVIELNQTATTMDVNIAAADAAALGRPSTRKEDDYTKLLIEVFDAASQEIARHDAQKLTLNRATISTMAANIAKAHLERRCE